MSGAKRLVKGVLGLPKAIIQGPESPGTPPVQEEPEEVATDEAIQTALAGDIAARNAQRRSSTLGTGARFIANSTAAGSGLQDTGPTPFFQERLDPSAGSTLLATDAVEEELQRSRRARPTLGGSKSRTV